MKFIEIEGNLINSDHIGNVYPNAKNKTILYILEGGRRILEVFETESEMEERLTELHSI